MENHLSLLPRRGSSMLLSAEGKGGAGPTGLWGALSFEPPELRCLELDLSSDEGNRGEEYGGKKVYSYVPPYLQKSLHKVINKKMQWYSHTVNFSDNFDCCQQLMFDFIVPP